MESDKVLGRGDRGGLATDIGSERYCELQKELKKDQSERKGGIQSNKVRSWIWAVKSVKLAGRKEKIESSCGNESRIAGLTRMSVKHKVGAATLLSNSIVRPSVTCKGEKSYIPNPHARKTGHTHKRQQDSTGFCSSEAQDTRDQQTVDVSLAQGGRDGETANEEHYSWGEHYGEYISGGSDQAEGRPHETSSLRSPGRSQLGAIFTPYYPQPHEKKRHEHGRYEQRNRLET